MHIVKDCPGDKVSRLYIQCRISNVANVAYARVSRVVTVNSLRTKDFSRQNPAPLLVKEVP